MSRTFETFLQLEQQLAEERVSALTRIGKRLESLIRALDELAVQCRQLSGALRVQALDDYRKRHDEARKYRWYLEVQREAVGLRRHQVIDRVFPMPPRSPLEVAAGREQES